MFRDFKTGGYNLEGTGVSDERLIALILLIAIAYTSATLLLPLYMDRKLNVWVYRKMSVASKNMDVLRDGIAVFTWDYMAILGSILWKVEPVAWAGFPT